MIAYQLTLDERPGYLHAKAVGERTPENAMRCLDEVYAACVRTGLANVLLEMAFTGPSLGAPGIIRVIEHASANGARLGRVAYVEASLDGLQRAKFAETVAVNRAVNVRLFDDTAQAAAWLASPPRR